MCSDLKKKSTNSKSLNLDKLLYDYTMAVCQKGAMKEFYNSNKHPEKAQEEAIEVGKILRFI